MGRHASLARICVLASCLEQAAGIGSLSHLERKVLRAEHGVSRSSFFVHSKLCVQVAT